MNYNITFIVDSLSSGTYFPLMVPKDGQNIPTHVSKTRNPQKIISWFCNKTQTNSEYT